MVLGVMPPKHVGEKKEVEYLENCRELDNKRYMQDDLLLKGFSNAP